jgi:hypothetical protein
VATQVIQDFAIMTVVASVMALVSYRLKQPMVIGYIAAGMIIGPYTPVLIIQPEIVSVKALHFQKKALNQRQARVTEKDVLKPASILTRISQSLSSVLKKVNSLNRLILST